MPERKIILDRLLPKLRLVMLAAIPKRLNHILCPNKNAPTSADIIIGVKTHIKIINASQQSQWKHKAESLRFEASNGIEVMLAEHDDAPSQMATAKYPHIPEPNTYIYMAKESMMTCPALE